MNSRTLMFNDAKIIEVGYKYKTYYIDIVNEISDGILKQLRRKYYYA